MKAWLKILIGFEPMYGPALVSQAMVLARVGRLAKDKLFVCYKLSVRPLRVVIQWSKQIKGLNAFVLSTKDIGTECNNENNKLWRATLAMREQRLVTGGFYGRSERGNITWFQQQFILTFI